MGSLDTRLHRLEAMVAGLLAWQNLAERQLQRQQKRLDDIAGAIGSILHCCTELEARVAALKHSVHEVDVDTNTRLRALEAGGPEPAAPAQAACPICGKTRLDTYWGPEACQCPRPKQAAQPAPEKDWDPDERGFWASPMPKVEQPAPQQPTACDVCGELATHIVEDWDGDWAYCDKHDPKQQPRSGGG